MNYPAHTDTPPIPDDLSEHIKQVERDILLHALSAYRWNRTQAGKAMGLTLRQMRYRMQVLGISHASPEFQPGTTIVVVHSCRKCGEPTEKRHWIGGETVL